MGPFIAGEMMEWVRKACASAGTNQCHMEGLAVRWLVSGSLAESVVVMWMCFCVGKEGCDRK